MKAAKATDGLLPSYSWPNLLPSKRPKSQSADVGGANSEASGNALVYRADALGPFRLVTAVNGTSLNFIADTGATFVSLSLEDAATPGIERGSLSFRQKQTQLADRAVLLQ